MPVPTSPPAGLTARALYGWLRRLTGAEIIGIRDTAGYFTGDTVEEALAELAGGVGSTDVAAAAATELTIAAGVVVATQTYHTIDTQADAGTDDLDTINGLGDGQFYVFKNASAARNVVFKHGTGNIINPSGQDITLDVTNDRIFGVSDGTSLFVLDMSLATASGGGLAKALAAVTNGLGASLVGIQDAGAFFATATVEAALAEIGPLLIGSADRFVKATIAVADTAGGGTAAALTLQLNRLDGATPIGAARQVGIVATVAQYGAELGNPSVTYSAATIGSIISSGNGWALVETNAAGAFACTASNSDDETTYFAASIPPHGVSDVTKGVLGVISNSDGATWSP